MANKNERKLMAEFPPVTTPQWEEVISADLKGGDYGKKLVWKTAEGFNVRPYYRAEDLAGIKYLGAGIAQFPFVRSTCTCNRWRIQQTICAGDPAKGNETARRAVAAGAEAICFLFGAEPDAGAIDTLLAGIDPTAVELSFYGASMMPRIAEIVTAKARKEGWDAENSRVNLLFDPIMNDFSMDGKFRCCQNGEKCIGYIKTAMEQGAGFAKWRFVNVGGEKFHNSGSTIVQELAFTLAAGHEYLVRLIEEGFDIDTAAKAMRFSMGVSANYFMEIAKFRAARMLWANIVNEYKPKCERSAKMRTHAVTSRWNLTVYDPYVNMLRGTTEAMSASIAGVHSLEVLPFDAAYEHPTEFSSRIARNVQLLLKHESHFDNVVDPSGGSYYIETLTNSIAEQAWNIFREVEEKGGYIAAFRSGFIPDAVAKSAEAKDKNIATRREILLGTNQFPNFTEVADEAVTEKTVAEGACCCPCSCSAEGGEELPRLRPYRGAMPFEQLRLQVDRSGRQPKAFMLTCGSLAQARARSQFSSNFFGCAGIRIMDNNFFASVEEGVKAALASGAEIVVMCAADDDYAALAPQAFKLLSGKAIFVVAGAPASQAELEAQGIKNFISVKSNVLQTLKSYVAELGIK